MVRIALIDLGMGNLRSVARALEEGARRAGVDAGVTLTAKPEELLGFDKIVMPGQGAFRDCAAALAAGLGEALLERIRAGVPFLGICLGLQALFDESEEAPGQKGLGVFRGAVRRLEGAEGIKIPHMGWNRIELTRAGAGALSAYEGDAPHLYFVHSYHAVPDDESIVAAVTHHGKSRVTAAVQHDNVLAVQFHPEKSQEAGLQLLERFLREG